MPPQSNRRDDFIYLALAAFAVHTFLSPFFFHPSDIADWWFYGFLEYHVGVSPLIYFLPYGPGTFYVMSYIYPLYLLASKNLFLPFILKVPSILLIILAGWYLWSYTKSTRSTALWLFSPLTFLTATLYGTTFDVIPIVLLFLAWMHVLEGKYRSSAILLAFAAVFKYYVLLAAPFFFIYILKKEARRHSEARTGFFNFLLAFVGLFVLLHLPYLEVYAGHPMIYWLITRTTPFYGISGFSGYRGADLNFLEYLNFDAGLRLPSFYVLFLPIYGCLLLSAIYKMTPNRTSFARFVLLCFAGYYLANPQLHLVYLLIVAPFMLVFRKGSRDFILYSGLVLIPYTLLQGGFLWLLFPEFRSLLGITLWSWENPFPFYWATYAGVTFACIYLLFLNPREADQPLGAPRSIRPIESDLRSDRARVLGIVCVALIIVSAISLIYASPDVQSGSPCPFCFAGMDNRMTGSMLHLRRSQFSNLVVSGQRNLTFDLIPQYFYSGSISNYMHLMLELNGSLTNYLAVRVNNRILWEYNSSYPMENMTTNIPVSWINGPDLVITITSPAWLLKWGVFRADLDVSHMPPPYFEKFGAALYLPQALSLGVLLAYLALQRIRKLRVQG